MFAGKDQVIMLIAMIAVLDIIVARIVVAIKSSLSRNALILK